MLAVPNYIAHKTVRKRLCFSKKPLSILESQFKTNQTKTQKPTKSKKIEPT